MRNLLFALVMLALLAVEPSALGQVDASAKTLDVLRKRAAESHSDSVIVFKNDELVLEWYADKMPPGPIDLMSCTKSIVNLAIGHLVDAGRIKSLDQPVHEFYPEWKQGQKKLITIKHLLNHTSGLQNFPNTSVEIYPSPDFVKLALAAEVVDAPGSKFSYNNKAVNLLAGIARIASGRRLDEYCSDELFRPMGITDFGWTLDKAGNPHCMSGLRLKAIDFAKFGQLILNKGLWKGTRLISEKWIEDSIAQGQPHQPICGLLWWRVLGDTHFQIDDAKFKELESAGVDKGFLDSLTPLKNKVFISQDSYYKCPDRSTRSRFSGYHRQTPGQ